VRFPLPLGLVGLAVLIAFVLGGASTASARLAPDPADVRSLRTIVAHYRAVTWTYERAAYERRTPTSFSDRRSTDLRYLQWAADTWTRRSYSARSRALARLHRKLRVSLPAEPRLHGRLSDRVSYSRALTLRLRKLYPGRVTRRFASAHGKNGRQTLLLWQKRSAAAALQLARHGIAHPELPSELRNQFLCIHRFEGDWGSDTGNGYYGGLQMDRAFQRLYGSDFVSRWGTADNWPVWAQLTAAARAYRSGRGFTPWPNTARACGLL
jgi:hypothetical protein